MTYGRDSRVSQTKYWLVQYSRTLVGAANNWVDSMDTYDNKSDAVIGLANLRSHYGTEHIEYRLVWREIYDTMYYENEINT